MERNVHDAFAKYRRSGKRSVSEYTLGSLAVVSPSVEFFRTKMGVGGVMYLESNVCSFV